MRARGQEQGLAPRLEVNSAAGKTNAGGSSPGVGAGGCGLEP